MGRSPRMTPDQKLEELGKAWGYAEVSEIVLPLSHWRVWLVKNYAGKPIHAMNGNGLPGNPTATRKIEYASVDKSRALTTAYRLTFKREKRVK